MGMKAFNELHSCAVGLREATVGRVEALAGGFFCKTELPIRQDSCAVAYMDSLASAAHCEADMSAE
jgi:hypothetical protein